MKKLLITGGSGFVGGHLINQSNGKWRVTTNYHKHQIDLPGCEWMHLDLKDTDKVAKVLEHVQPNVVLHLAALSNLDFCEQHQDIAYATNVEATAFLAEWCQNASVRLVFLSSDMVYDGEKGNYCESDAVGPLGVYAQTKVRGEDEIRTRCRNHVIVRTALVYGKPVGGGTSFTEWVEQRLRQGQKVPLYTDQYRTPILVNNLADILLEIAEGDFIGTLNVGGPDKTDRFYFGRKYCRFSGLNENLLKPIAMNNGPHLYARRPRDLSFDISKARSVLKIRLLGINEGLRIIF